MNIADEMRKIADEACAAKRAMCLKKAKSYGDYIINEKIKPKANECKYDIDDIIQIPSWIDIQLVIKYLEDVGFGVEQLGDFQITVNWYKK